MRWGGPKNTDIAVILAVGSERDMRQLLNEKNPNATNRNKPQNSGCDMPTNKDHASKKRKADPKVQLYIFFLKLKTFNCLFHFLRHYHLLEVLKAFSF